MMGRRTADQARLFYAFSLEERIPVAYLLRRIDVFVTRALADVHREMAAFYSHIGRPSIDPELLVRMLIVGYCCGIRSERRLCEEVSLNLPYRWFCRPDLDDAPPAHSPFPKNRHGRFCDSDLLRLVFERVVGICLAAGPIKGEAFAVDASVIEADASRYHGLAPEEIDWSAVEKPSRAVREYLDALDRAEEAEEGRKVPKVISLSDPASAWTAKANKRVQFGYGLNYLIDNEHAIVVDVEPTPARTFDEVRATATMLDRTRERFGIVPQRLAADTAYGTAKFLGWLVERRIAPHIPVWEKGERDDAFDRSDFTFDPARDAYTCLAGKLLVHQRRTFRTPRLNKERDNDGSRRYRASTHDCGVCPLKPLCCPKMPARRLTRTVHEEARDIARSLTGTPEFLRSRNERKKVEM